MSLRPTAIEPVPEQTACIAKAAFPKGNPYLILRDEVGVLFQDEMFAHLFPKRGQPAAAPWRLALITMMQFAEDLSDSQAACQTARRIGSSELENHSHQSISVRGSNLYLPKVA